MKASSRLLSNVQPSSRANTGVNSSLTATTSGVLKERFFFDAPEMSNKNVHVKYLYFSLSGCPRAKKSGIKIIHNKEDKDDQEPIK